MVAASARKAGISISLGNGDRPGASIALKLPDYQITQLPNPF